MRVPVVPERFAADRASFALRFCCEECAYFFVEPERCAHGWPTPDHRRARYEPQPVQQVVFCKEFELR